MSLLTGKIRRGRDSRSRWRASSIPTILTREGNSSKRNSRLFNCCTRRACLFWLAPIRRPASTFSRASACTRSCSALSRRVSPRSKPCRPQQLTRALFSAGRPVGHNREWKSRRPCVSGWQSARRYRQQPEGFRCGCERPVSFEERPAENVARCGGNGKKRAAEGPRRQRFLIQKIAVARFFNRSVFLCYHSPPNFWENQL